MKTIIPFDINKYYGDIGARIRTRDGRYIAQFTAFNHVKGKLCYGGVVDGETVLWAKDGKVDPDSEEEHQLDLLIETDSNYAIIYDVNEGETGIKACRSLEDAKEYIKHYQEFYNNAHICRLTPITFYGI